MDKSILLLFLINALLQVSQSSECDEKKERAPLFIEWEAFPKGSNPDYYYITSVSHPSLDGQNITRKSSVQKIYSTSILINNHEDHTCNITIESVKNGYILTGKSILKEMIDLSDIKIFVTSTSVSFNWTTISGNAVVSVILNNSTREMPLNENYHEWESLKSGKIHNFALVFKQLFEFINISQTINIPIETGRCSQGWHAYKKSCYQISQGNKNWDNANHSCQKLYPGAHLVNVQTEEEHQFLSSYLYKINDVILLWSGLNDKRDEGELLWTDGSSYNLNKAEVLLLSNLPKNETDCYALQQNATGPNYFYTAFFCQVDLPYICEYEFPIVPENVTFSLEITTESEVMFQWSNIPNWAQTGYNTSIKYFSNATDQYSENISPHLMQNKIKNLFPGHKYSFILCIMDNKGSQYNLSPVLSAETRPLKPSNLQTMNISSTSIHLQWKPPVGRYGELFCKYILTLWDVEENSPFMSVEPNSKTSTIITKVKPYHQYNIFLQTMSASGKLSSAESLLSLITGVSPPQNVTVNPEDVNEHSLIVRWEPTHESTQYIIRVKAVNVAEEIAPNMTESMNQMNLSSLTPGMTYELGVVAVQNGNQSQAITFKQTLKPKPVTFVVPVEVSTHEVILFVKMPDVGIFDAVLIRGKPKLNRTLLFSTKGDGKFAIDELVPGTNYEFSIFVQSDGMLSIPCNITSVKTCLAIPTHLHEGEVTETSIEVLWDRAEGNFYQYEIICKNCSDMSMVQKVSEEKAVFFHLIPGTVYVFSVRTEKEQFKDSIPITIHIQTVPSPVEFVNHTKNSGSITLRWKAPFGQVGGYTLTMIYENINKTEKLPASKSLHRLSNLIPGMDYIFSLVTTCGLRISSPAIVNISTDPDPPSDFKVFVQGEDSVYVSWKIPRGRYQHFQLTCQTTDGKTLFKITTVTDAIPVKNLLPGEEYMFQIITIRDKDASIPIEKIVTTIPTGICGLTVKSASSSSTTLTWNPTTTSFTHYVVKLSNNTYVREYILSRELSEHTIGHLMPGGIYNFTVQRIKGDVGGSRAYMRVIIEPETPMEVKAFNISSQYFSLSWRKPYGLVERYRVDLFPPYGFVNVRDLGDGEYQADISSSAPGTMYTVTISSVSSSALSLPVSKSVITNETIPGPPLHLAGERVGSAGILLSWNIPRNPNGKILSYSVTYREICPWVQASYSVETTHADSFEVLLTSLTPGTTYEIKVAAANSAGLGSYSESFLFQTAESAPGKVVNLTVEALNSSAVNLTWFLPRQPHGKITSFKISVKHARSGIIVKDTTVKVEDILNGPLPECHDKSEIFLWSTTSPPSTRGQPTTTFPLVSRTVTASTFNSIWNEPITFIVGQLRPYTTYLFEVSAVTSEPGYIDSTIVRTPESVPEDPPQNLAKGNITARSFSVTWDAPTIVTGKFSYRVELYGPNARIFDNSTKDLRFTFTNLTPFTTYDAYISGETSAGVGPRANISVFTPAEVPSAVSDLNAKEVQSNYLVVEWRRPPQPNGIIIKYRVKAMVKDTGVVIENTILTGKKISNNLDYVSSTPMNENMKTTGKETITGIYEGSTDMYSTFQTVPYVTIHNTVTENVLYGIDIDAEQLSYTIEKLSPYTDYVIYASAFTSIGEGPPTNIVVRTSEQVPSSVEKISYRNISSTSVLVSWDPPSKPNGMITHYTVYAMELHTSEAFHVVTNNNSFLITGLKKYTDYKMRVTASTSAGESALSKENDIYVRTLEDVPDSPPQNLSIIDVNATSITLEWMPPAEPNGIITHYEIVYAYSTVIYAENTTAITFTLKGLNPYTLYKISVRAYTRFGHGNKATSEMSVRTSETAPSSPPYDVYYRNVSSTRVLVTWKPPVHANGIILFYNISYWNITHYLTCTSNESMVMLSDLGKYSQYQIVVSSHTVHGDGNQASDVIYVHTMEDVPDDAPHILSYRNLNSTSIELFYSPPFTPNGMITFYVTKCVDIDGSYKHFNSSRGSVIISGLRKYSEYQITVRASTSVGIGMESSSPLFVRTDEDVPDSAPEDISYRNVSSTEILVSYSPPAIPNGIIKHYTLYIKRLNGTTEREVNTTELAHIITGLNKYTVYILVVSANTVKGEGVSSAPLTIITEEDAPSSPPLSLHVTQLSSAIVKLSWKQPLEPNGIILFYTVSIWNEESNKTINVKDTSLELMDLENNKEYYTFVTTSTRFGDGNVKSDTLKFRTAEGAPSDPPKNVSYRNISSTSIMVFWIPPTRPNGVILFYSIYYKNSIGTYVKNVTDDDITSIVYNAVLSAIVDGLAKYTQYSLWITASTIQGDGNQYSEVISIKTEQDVPDSEPMISECKNLTSSSVLLSWDPPAQPNGIITSYHLQIYGPQGNSSLNTSHISTNLTDLVPYSQYSIHIAARTAKGTGPYNTFIILTDEAEPSSPPQNLTFINATENAAWFQWRPSPNPNGFVRGYSFKVVENNSQVILFQNISGGQTEARLTALEPFKTYFASISAFTKVGNGDQFSNIVSFKTKESVPDPVQTLQCTPTSWQSVLVQWDPPFRPNGLVTHFILKFQNITTWVSSAYTIYTFRDLLPNTTYLFTIKAANSVGEGIEQTCNATTKPEEVPSAPKDVTLFNVQSTSIEVRWNRPDYTNGYLRNYKITVQLLRAECDQWDIVQCVELVHDIYSYDDRFTIEKIIFGLKKFRRYKLKVSASTSAGYGVSSRWIHVQTLPGPVDGPPENVTVTAISHESINISWKAPSIITGPTSFIINVTSVNSEEYAHVFIKCSNESQNLVVSNLKPFTKYSIIVIAFTGDFQSAYLEGQSSNAVIAITLEAVPNDPPKNITFQKIPNEVTKVQIHFIPPEEPNGQIRVFQAIVYKEDDPTVIQIHNLSIIRKSNNSITALIEGLKGGHTYNISIYAVNGAGAGPNIQMRITTDVKEPPKPSKRPIPVYDSTGSVVATSTTMTIKMPICYFSENNGPIRNIQILVSEVGAQHDGNVTKWHEAYFKKPKPYFTSEGFPNPPCYEGRERFYRKEEMYVIGADDTCALQDNEDKFCNGPLKPRKQYLFKFRATNTKGQFTDSDYSDVVKTTAEGLSERAVEIILSVTLCILSVILLVAAIYAFARIRQKQKEGGTYSPRDAEIIDTKFKLDQLITVADLELKDERLTRPVSKKGFLQHVEELCANNNLKFQEEFSELPKFLEDLAVSDADLPWNRSKNRFTNIKPYNNNRVKLIADAGVPGSDYINASYVSGYICPNEFIATQGPLAGTVGDFWRMVWETRAKTVVMLTQCFEKGRIRCHQYWPEDNKPVTVFGDIVITKVAEDVQIDWTTRDLKVERHGDFMMVRQCNFTSWPEHGVPENATSVIHFVKMVRASRPHENTPTIIHCSAGVGRTGVLIALDHLVQHINHHDFVDIYGLVAELRSERMCMVQNLAQYIFLHQCAVDLLASKGSNQAAICFVNYPALQKMDSLDAMEGDVELEWEETTM